MTGEGRAPCEVLKVAGASKPVSVAGAIAGVIRSQQRVEVHAIGAGAVNQAIKAIAISRGYDAPSPSGDNRTRTWSDVANDPGCTRRDHRFQFVCGCMRDCTYSGLAVVGRRRTSRQPRG